MAFGGMRHTQYTQTRCIRALVTSLFLCLSLVFTAPANSQNTSATPAFPILWPIDCTLGSDCWIARYPDRGPGNSAADYRCNIRTQDGHDGTDIALADIGRLDDNVTVKAAAGGVVWRLRDGVPDQVLNPDDYEEVTKIGCGNAVVIRHEGGWQTAYCHMKENSLTVKQGDRVKAGTPIGAVGLSGETEFPHLHFMVHHFKDGKRTSIDPFDGKPLGQLCTPPQAGSLTPLWRDAVPYEDTALLPPLVSDKRPQRLTVWQRQPETLPANSRVLYMQVRGFHSAEDDIWHLALIGSDGKEIQSERITQDNNRQRITANLTALMPPGGFQPGTWQAIVKLERGGEIVTEQKSSFTLTP